jgi:hypothetical protein
MSTEFDDGDAIDTDSQGRLVFGSTGVPGVAHPIAVDATGHIILGAGTSVLGSINVQGPASGDWLEPHTTDYDTGGGTNSVTAFGVAVPGAGGAIVINGDGTYGLDVDVTRSALPAGAATSALQTSSEAILTTIDADTGAIKTSLELIDNAISGSEMQVDVVAALPAGTNTIGNTHTKELVYISQTEYTVDAAAVTLVDASAIDSTTKYIRIVNCAETNVYIRVGGTDPIAPSATANFSVCLAPYEDRWFPFGYLAGAGTLNDIKGIRSAAATNDNVVVELYAFAA